MSQTITAVPVTQAAAPSFYTTWVTGPFDSIQSNLIVRRVIEVASIPLSIVATFGLQPYLILDPTTSLVGIACAVLVNTVALHYLHQWIQDKWTNYWYINPIPPTIESVTLSEWEAIRRLADDPMRTPIQAEITTSVLDLVHTPIATETTTPVLDPAPLLIAPQTVFKNLTPLEKSYQDALTDLDRATRRLNLAKAKRAEADQGRNAGINNLLTAELNLRKELIKCANSRQDIIQKLIEHEIVLKDCGVNIAFLKEFIPEEARLKNCEEDVEKAEKTLKIDLSEIHQRLSGDSGEFRKACVELIETCGKLYYSQNTDILCTNVLRDGEKELQNIIKKLTVSKTKLKKIENTLELTNKQFALTNRDLDTSARSVSQAQNILEQINTKLAEKTKKKEELLSEINKLEMYGSSSQKELDSEKKKGGTDDLYKYQSKATLKKLIDTAEPCSKDSSQESLEIEQVITQLDKDLKLLRDHINNESNSELGILGAWSPKFEELKNKAAAEHKKLKEKAFSEYLPDGVQKFSEPLFRKKDQLTSEQKETHLTYYQTLEKAAIDLLKKNINAVSVYDLVKSSHPPGYLFPEPPPLDPNSSIDDIEYSVETYITSATCEINTRICRVNNLLKLGKTLELGQLKSDPDNADYAICQNLDLLPHGFSGYTITIRNAQQKIFGIREKNIKNKNLHSKLKQVFDQREREIELLKATLEEVEQDKIDPIKKEYEKAIDSWAQKKAEQQALEEEVSKINSSLTNLEKQKTDTNAQIKKYEKEEQENLNNRITLAKKVQSLAPVMIFINQISEIQIDPNSNLPIILNNYRDAKKTREKKETATPLKITETQEELKAAEKGRNESSCRELTAFQLLAEEYRSVFDKNIKDLRGSRYQSIILKSAKIRNFYHQKDENLNTNESFTSTGNVPVHPSEIQELSREILEKKIKIATKIAKKNSFSSAWQLPGSSSLNREVDQARLTLAIHQLERHRMEEKWKTSLKMDAKEEGNQLIKQLESEQRLVFRYFGSKLHRDSNTVTQQAVKAKANLAILNLILDKIKVEVSNLKVEDRREFDIVKKISDELNTIMKTEDAKEFNTLAYSPNQTASVQNQQNQQTYKDWLLRRPPANPQAKITNLFVEALQLALDRENQKLEALKLELTMLTDEDRYARNKDGASIFSSLKLTNFLEEVSIKSSHLHAKDTPNYTAQLIENKIELIQRTLTKPDFSESRFKDQIFTSYQREKNTYRGKKYQEKIKSATIIAAYKKNKELFTKFDQQQKDLAEEKKQLAEKREEAKKKKKEDRQATLTSERRTAQEQLEAERRTAQERLEAERRTAQERLETEQRTAQDAWDRFRNETDPRLRTHWDRNNELANRNESVENYGWVEKLSYLIPSAALWALYQFSPLLSYIDLSLRVSQNILLISSATHLFVQSFFRNPLSNINLRNAHPIQTQPINSLLDRVTTT